MKLIACFSPLLYSLDLFKIPYPFSIAKNPKYSTFQGSFLSLVLIGFVIFMIVNSDMVKKTNPVTISMVEPTQISPELPIFGNSLGLTVGLIDMFGKTYQDPSVFSIDFAQILYNLNTTTYQREMVIEKVFSSHRCNRTDYRTTFSQRANNYTCLDHPPPHVSGSLSENNMDALTVNFRLCNNKTENPKGIICKPPEVIKALIQSKMVLIGSYDYYVDAKDYVNPIKPHFILQSPLSLDLNLIQNAVISLRSLQVIDDDSLVLEAQSTTQGFKFADFESHFVTVSDFSAQNTVANPFLRIAVTSSPYNEKFSRRYQKVPDLLANISGVLSAILLFVGFVMNIFSEVRLRKYVANALYIIHDISSSKKAKEKKADYITTLAAKINPTTSGLITTEKMNLTRKDLEQNIELNSNNLERPPMKIINEDPVLDEEEQEKSNKEFEADLRKFIESRKHKENSKFKMSAFDYFKYGLKAIFKRPLNSKEFLFKESVDLIAKKSDVIYIMKKIDEIDKLKHIVFNQEQAFLFDLLAKPTLSYEKNKTGLFSLKSNMSSVRKSIKMDINDEKELKIKKLINYLSQKDGSNSNQIDKNLLEMLNDELHSH